MVNKITKKRLKNVLAYDGLKILILSVIVCIVVVLIFNAFAKKPSDGQDFKLIVDDDLIYDYDEVDKFLDELFQNGVDNGGFSYETLQGDFISLRDNDESPKNYMLNSIYAELTQDDVCVLQEEIYKQYIEQNNAVDIIAFIDNAFEFLFSEGLCDVDGNFNQQKVNDYFIRTRGNDSRFRTQEEIANGKANELKRLQAIYRNATALKACFEAHPELLDERTYSYGDAQITGKFAIVIGNLNGNAQTGRYAEKLFKRSYENEDGETVYTTDGIYIAFGNNYAQNGDIIYENLAFMYTLIKTYSTYITI